MEKRIGPGSKVVTEDGRKGEVFSISGDSEDSDVVVRLEPDQSGILKRPSKIDHFLLGQLHRAA